MSDEIRTMTYEPGKTYIIGGCLYYCAGLSHNEKHPDSVILVLVETSISPVFCYDPVVVTANDICRQYDTIYPQSLSQRILFTRKAQQWDMNV